MGDSLLGATIAAACPRSYQSSSCSPERYASCSLHGLYDQMTPASARAVPVGARSVALRSRTVSLSALAATTLDSFASRARAQHAKIISLWVRVHSFSFHTPRALLNNETRSPGTTANPTRYVLYVARKGCAAWHYGSCETARTTIFLSQAFLHHLHAPIVAAAVIATLLYVALTIYPATSPRCVPTYVRTIPRRGAFHMHIWCSISDLGCAISHRVSKAGRRTHTRRPATPSDRPFPTNPVWRCITFGSTHSPTHARLSVINSIQQCSIWYVSSQYVCATHEAEEDCAHLVRVRVQSPMLYVELRSRLLGQTR